MLAGFLPDECFHRSKRVAPDRLSTEEVPGARRRYRTVLRRGNFLYIASHFRPLLQLPFSPFLPQHFLPPPRPSSGVVDINGVRIRARDGAAIKDEDLVTITAIEEADLVMVYVH